jgi:hypothetical protein
MLFTLTALVAIIRWSPAYDQSPLVPVLATRLPDCNHGIRGVVRVDCGPRKTTARRDRSH